MKCKIYFQWNSQPQIRNNSLSGEGAEF